MADLPTPRPNGGGPRHLGTTLDVVVHAVLLVLLATELVVLGSTYRLRLDLTSDARFSLTDATERVLSRLESPLVLEVYLSPDKDLGVRWAEKRRVFREVLDEFVQRGDGRVRLEFFDPVEDSEIRAKAERLGIRPNPIQDFDGGTLSRREVWQGLRMTYGGRLQRVVGFVPFTDHTAAYESLLTPLVAALLQGERPKVGIAFWGNNDPTAGGYERLLSLQAFQDRFEFVPLDFAVRDRIPSDLDTVVLIGPRQLTPVQKYALDQFLLRGGTAVCFLDGIDVLAANWRALPTQSVQWDAGDGLSGLFVEQLRHYGVEVEGPGKVLADDGSSLVPFRVPGRKDLGGGRVGTEWIELRYPYWFRATSTDWSERAALLARNLGGDDQLAYDLGRVLEPGIDPSVERLLIAPEVFWPIAVDPTTETPAGLDVRTLIRTSPLQAVLRTGQSVFPSETGDLEDGYRGWLTRLRRTTTDDLALGRQRGLLVEAKGLFSSFFDGIPPARPEDEIAAVGAVGPTEVEDDRTRLVEGVDEGRLLVFGDATFLRDDYAFGDLASVGAPSRTLGHSFFLSLLDWLVGEDDLIELRERRPVDRRQVFVDPAERSTLGLSEAAQIERSRVSDARTANLIAPLVAVGLLGVVVVLMRRARGRRFVALVRQQEGTR